MHLHSHSCMYVAYAYRHNKLCTTTGLAIFLAVAAVVVSMKFRLKIAGWGPYAHLRAPAYVGEGGLGGAVVSALLQAATRPVAAPPFLGYPERPVPCRSRTARFAQRAFRTCSSRARRPASLRLSYPIGWLGCLPGATSASPWW